MKRFFCTVLGICLALMLTFPVYAGNDRKIVDQADVLTAEEENILLRQAEKLADLYDMDVVILTVADTDGTDVATYADDYFDENGYGIGADYSGVLFLLAIENREWAISTCGDAVYALTDYGILVLFETFDQYLAEDQFFQAFDTYLQELPAYFDAYEAGSPIDSQDREDENLPGYLNPPDREDVVYHPEERDSPEVGDVLGILFGSLVLGAAAGGIILLILRGMMKTAVPQKSASSYLIRDSYHLKQHRNIFLYSKVSRIRRERNTNTGTNGHGGGGSSIHRSSGGRSHGGRSGRF